MVFGEIEYTGIQGLVQYKLIDPLNSQPFPVPVPIIAPLPELDSDYEFTLEPLRIPQYATINFSFVDIFKIVIIAGTVYLIVQTSGMMAPVFAPMVEFLQ